MYVHIFNYKKLWKKEENHHQIKLFILVYWFDSNANTNLVAAMASPAIYN